MAHYVMVGEGKYPVAAIKKCHRDHLKVKNWMMGNKIGFVVPEPIIYELQLDEYDEAPNIKKLSDHLPIPFMHTNLYMALLAVGVDNLQVFDAVIRDLKRGVDHHDYKAFNVVGKVAAADMDKSRLMGTTDSVIIDTDFDALFIDETKCQNFLLFRLAENIASIVVDERVKREVEKRGIEGVVFYANGEWTG